MSETAAPHAAPRDPYTPYRATLLSPERVKELSRLRPWHVVVETLLCWLCIGAAWTLVWLRREWWAFAIALPVIGTRYYALFIIGHDGLHRRLFESKRFNDLFNDVLIMAPIGAITRLNNKNHLLHHRHLANPWDPDRHRHGSFNKATRAALLAFLTGLSSLGRSVANVFRGKRASAAEFAAPEGMDTSGRGYSIRDLLVLLFVQAALIGGLSWWIGWWAYPALWLAPVFVFTILGDNLRSFAEHSQPEPDANADAHRLITFRSNIVERLFLAPMNMNYHAAHHLWVSIPYYNLPSADREMRASGATGNLEWRGSYLAYLLRYALAMPLPECLK